MMNVFLHIVALDEVVNVCSPAWRGWESGESWSTIARSIVSMDDASRIGVAALMTVLIADGLTFAQIWSEKSASLVEREFSWSDKP